MRSCADKRNGRCCGTTLPPASRNRTGSWKASAAGSETNASTNIWPSRGSADHRSMEDRLQHRTPAYEPGWAHSSRLCKPLHAGAYREQTLLMNEGKVGAGSNAKKAVLRFENGCPGGVLETLVAGTRNTRSLRNGGAGPESPASVVAGDRNTRFLRLVEQTIPNLAA